jgi:hypothetical protein
MITAVTEMTYNDTDVSAIHRSAVRAATTLFDQTVLETARMSVNYRAMHRGKKATGTASLQQVRYI